MVGVVLGWEVLALVPVAQVLVVWEVLVAWVLAVWELAKEVRVEHSCNPHLAHICEPN
jgi:hypothetical protein